MLEDHLWNVFVEIIQEKNYTMQFINPVTHILQKLLQEL